jgi:hypothetical protein
MILEIKSIEFDFDGEVFNGKTQLQNKLQKHYVGQSFNVEDEDDVVDYITNECGWCINRIEFSDNSTVDVPLVELAQSQTHSSPEAAMMT